VTMWYFKCISRSLMLHLEHRFVWCWNLDIPENISDVLLEKVSWTHRVKNREVLHRVNEELNVLHTIKRRKGNWIVHFLRRNCVLKHVIEVKMERKMERMGRRGRRRKQLLDNLKGKRRYWREEGALDLPLCRTRFGGGCGTVARH
jgi:hypothetical protein